MNELNVQPSIMYVNKQYQLQIFVDDYAAGEIDPLSNAFFQKP